MIAVRNRFLRRILFVILILAVIDSQAPIFVNKIEANYENSKMMFRFENNDVFGIRPLIDYLRENMMGKRERIAFFGNSVMFGYQLAAYDAVPAKVEAITEFRYKCLNLALNGGGEEISYLFLKNIIDYIDLAVFIHAGSSRKPLEIYYRNLDIDAQDAEYFGIERGNEVKVKIEQAIGRIWKLFGYAHRIQAALFMTSTKNYFFLHKSEIFQRLLLKKVIEPSIPPIETYEDYLKEWHIPETPEYEQIKGDMLGSHDCGADIISSCELYKKLFNLLKGKGKKAYFFGLKGINAYSEKELLEYNKLFNPNLLFINLDIPDYFVYDGQHLNSKGSATVATMMYSIIRKNNDI